MQETAAAARPARSRRLAIDVYDYRLEALFSHFQFASAPAAERLASPPPFGKQHLRLDSLLSCAGLLLLSALDCVSSPASSPPPLPAFRSASQCTALVRIRRKHSLRLEPFARVESSRVDSSRVAQLRASLARHSTRRVPYALCTVLYTVQYTRLLRLF